MLCIRKTTCHTPQGTGHILLIYIQYPQNKGKVTVVTNRDLSLICRVWFGTINRYLASQTDYYILKCLP